VVFKPKLISEETLFNGYSWAFQEIYSYTSIAKRILMPPQKRVVPELVSNLAFRRMVMRAPKGRIPIMSRVLGKLNTSIPIKDKKNLVPTFVDATFEKSQQMLKSAGRLLKVKATHNERFRTLFIKLEGSLDLSAAKKLFKRLSSFLNKGQRKIVIDFKGVEYLSPKAANLLVMKNLSRLFKKRNQIEMRNFSQIANGAFTNITNLISCEKDSPLPREIEPRPSQEKL
jgi:hypothetical protein